MFGVQRAADRRRSMGRWLGLRCVYNVFAPDLARGSGVSARDRLEADRDRPRDRWAGADPTQRHQIGGHDDRRRFDERSAV